MPDMDFKDEADSLKFFEKLSSHLSKANRKVDNFDFGLTGDKMNLSMMNMVTMW